MNWKLAFAALALGCSALAAPGCAADADPIDDADAEEAAASQDEINAASAKLVGAYHHSGGAMRPPTFQGLVLKGDGTFFADVDTGIRCVRAPCPSHARLEGKYSATKAYLRLSPKQSGGEGAGFYGRYKYTVGKDGALSLSRSGQDWSGWSNDLSKEGSYCQQATDCWGQDIIHPMCLGSWVCGGGINNESSNQCGWSCDFVPPPPASDLYPSDASKLVAQTSGGGFTPPPPPNSQCLVGAAKYELDVATKKLAYEYCEFIDWQTPFTKKSGTKTLTAAELKTVEDAAKAMTLATEQVCGADKPYLTVTVTSASQGTKELKDSFYSCDGNGTYVDGIDGVFRAFREVTGQQ